MIRALRSALTLSVALGAVMALSCGDTISPTTCYSGEFWARGDQGDNWMHPGRPCIQCHQNWHRGPLFTAAGTLYARPGQGDECNGFPNNFNGPDQHAEVEITDQTGRPFVIVANRVGNFFTTHAFQFPLQKIRVRWPDGTLKEMTTPAPHGDCNACHTVTGTTTVTGGDPASGRISQAD